jgi:hypothetical protein
MFIDFMLVNWSLIANRDCQSDSAETMGSLNVD